MNVAENERLGLKQALKFSGCITHPFALFEMKIVREIFSVSDYRSEHLSSESFNH